MSPKRIYGDESSSRSQLDNKAFVIKVNSNFLFSKMILYTKAKAAALAMSIRCYS
jgi:hypothetical protein